MEEVKEISLRERLSEFHKDRPQDWCDVKDVINVCMNNASQKALSIEGKNRDIYIGKYIMAKEIIKAIEEFKDGKDA